MNKNLHPDISNAGVGEPRSWEELKESLRRIFTTLRDDDLNYDESQKEEMIVKLQSKLGKTRAELISIFEII